MRGGEYLDAAASRGAVAVARAGVRRRARARAASRSALSSPRATAAGGSSAGCISISPRTARTPSGRSPSSRPTPPRSPRMARFAMRRSARRLREYAGAGAKSELLRLLEPVSRASESCAWLKAIVDTGEIFHPLRWTPRGGDAAARRRRGAGAGGRRRAHAGGAGARAGRAGRRSRRRSARRRLRWSAPRNCSTFRST